MKGRDIVIEERTRTSKFMTWMRSHNFHFFLWKKGGGGEGPTFGSSSAIAAKTTRLPVLKKLFAQCFPTYFHLWKNGVSSVIVVLLRWMLSNFQICLVFAWAWAPPWILMALKKATTSTLNAALMPNPESTKLSGSSMWVFHSFFPTHYISFSWNRVIELLFLKDG